MPQRGGVYAHGCARHAPAGSYLTHFMVCRACLPDFVPACQLCKAPSEPAYEAQGFLAYPWGKLCPACVARVRSAGDWRERRATANAARASALCERFPTLRASLRARTTHVEGAVEGRRVHVRLRLAARQYQSERYVFAVECRAREAPEASSLTARFHTELEPVSVRLTTERVRWLRVAFAHLGKRDVVVALEQGLALAAALEAAP